MFFFGKREDDTELQKKDDLEKIRRREENIGVSKENFTCEENERK